jgi:phosphocarrier protein HPr
MIAKKLIVKNKHGLHARVALRVVEKSKILPSEVLLLKGTKKADAHSVLDLLMLEAAEGSEIELIITGGDEENSLREIETIFDDGAGI